jgi:hypothetical protein
MPTTQMYIDPYGSQPYHSTSSKKIFKENNLRSGVIHSNYLNKLTNIFEDNSILKGLKLTNVYRSQNNRRINFIFSQGKLIQDSTLVDITQSATVYVDVFSTYTITGISTSTNYFEISGNHVENFPINKTFAIFNSNESSYNHLNWTCINSEYVSGNKTRVYTSSSLTVNDVSGQIVNNNFPDINDSLYGTIILTTNYKFIRYLEDNDLEIVPVYMTSDNKYFPEFDINSNQIILSVITIEKDLTNYIVLPTAYEIKDVPIWIYGTEYQIRKTTDSSINVVDGLELSPSTIVIYPNYFVFDVQTVGVNDTFTLPLESDGTYNFFIKWGDGTSNTITAYNSSNITHTYAVEGLYEIQIIGTLIGWRFNNSGDKSLVRTIKYFGCLNVGTNSNNFYGCNNLTLDNITNNLFSIEGLTDLDYMFAGNSLLTNLDLSSQDFSDIVSMNNFLNGVTLTTTIYNSLLTSLANRPTHTINNFESYDGGAKVKVLSNNHGIEENKLVTILNTKTGNYESQYTATEISNDSYVIDTAFIDSLTEAATGELSYIASKFEYNATDETKVTAVGHKVVNGNTITFEDTLYYDGSYTVSDVSGNTFVIDIGFTDSISDTGVGKVEHTITSFEYHSTDETKVISSDHTVVDGSSVTITNSTYYDGTYTVSESASGEYVIDTSFIDDDSGVGEETHNITLLEDDNGTHVKITAVGHTVVNSNTVIITGTTDYDGTYVSSGVSGNTYLINTPLDSGTCKLTHDITKFEYYDLDSLKTKITSAGHTLVDSVIGLTITGVNVNYNESYNVSYVKHEITSFEYYSTDEVKVIAANHDVSNGDSVTITGSINYNGTYTVSGSVSGSYVIDTSFIDDDTGFGDEKSNDTYLINTPFDAGTGRLDLRTQTSDVDFGNSQYSGTAATNARSFLVSEYSWTILDGGAA